MYLRKPNLIAGILNVDFRILSGTGAPDFLPVRVTDGSTINVLASVEDGGDESVTSGGTERRTIPGAQDRQNLGGEEQMNYNG